jgi:GntR family transcriptional regulator
MSANPNLRPAGHASRPSSSVRDKDRMDESPRPGDSDRSLLVELDKGDLVDPESAIPYYYQMQKRIENKVLRGEWKPGQKLPSENALCDHFGVSRTVVRQALNALATSGRIETHRGKGSFVATPKYGFQQMQSLTSFYQDAVASGQNASSKVLELSVIPASAEIASFLQLRDDESVILLHRLRYIGDEPILVSLTYLPERFCPGLEREDFTSQSLYALLAEKYGLVIAEGRRTIESVNAPSNLAHLLGVPAGSALSLLKSVGYLADGQALEYFISWHRGDRSRFQVRAVNAAR